MAWEISCPAANRSSSSKSRTSRFIAQILFAEAEVGRELLKLRESQSMQHSAKRTGIGAHESLTLHENPFALALSDRDLGVVLDQITDQSCCEVRGRDRARVLRPHERAVDNRGRIIGEP